MTRPTFRVVPFADRTAVGFTTRLLTRAASMARARAKRDDVRYVVLDGARVVYVAIPGQRVSLDAYQRAARQAAQAQADAPQMGLDL